MTHNPYRQLKKIARKHQLTREELLHALMATIYANGCDQCSDTFHSQNFMKAFNRMATDIKVTKDLSKKPEVA